MQDIFDPDDRPIDEDETAVILGVKVPTLASMRSQGRGPKYYKQGRFIRYTPRFIKEYLAACERVPEPASVRRQRKALAAEAAQGDAA
jgi:hypothetical protein